MNVDNNTLKMYLSFGEEIEGRLIPYYLLKDWKDCTVDGRGILIIREFVAPSKDSEELQIYQYYVTPIMYALMTGQYELARQLIEKGCDTFFWEVCTYHDYNEMTVRNTGKISDMYLPCYLLLHSRIPTSLRKLLWEHIDEEMNDRDQPVFLTMGRSWKYTRAFGIRLLMPQNKWMPAREVRFIHNIANLIEHHPRVAYKLEGGLYRVGLSLDSRMRLHKMLAPLYVEDASKQSGLLSLCQIDEDDVNGTVPCTRNHQTLAEFCKKHNGVAHILKYFEDLSQYFQKNISLRQLFFENLIVNLARLEEVASYADCKKIEAFAKQYYEPTSRVDVVALHCLEANSFEFVQRSNLFFACLDQPMEFEVNNEIAKEYIEAVVGIVNTAGAELEYRNGYTGEQMLKQWLNHFRSIAYHNPHSLPFSMDRLFECKDRELIVMAIRKGLLPKERCEEYIAYCLEERYMEYIPFLLYLRSELYFS